MSMFRPIALTDLPAAAEFDRKVDRPINSTFDPDFYRWQFLRSGGKNFVDSPAYAAWQDQNVIATAMLSDIDVKVGEGIVNGSFLHEWYADPKAGFIGLKLIGSLLERLPVIIGAGPSIASMITFRRLRPLYVLPLQRLILPLDPKTAATLSFNHQPQTQQYLQSMTPRRPKSLPKIEALSSFDDHYDALWIEMRKIIQIGAERTARYMNWRYCEHPRFTYRICRINQPTGDAVFVWRTETPPGHTHSVIRLCDAIGVPDALAAAVPALFAYWRDSEPESAFADFYCSHDEVCAALLEGGFSHHLVMPGLDLPRLFQPLANDSRKTLYFYLSLSRDLGLTPRFIPGRSYLTKGDSNQDRPNP